MKILDSVTYTEPSSLNSNTGWLMPTILTPVMAADGVTIDHYDPTNQNYSQPQKADFIAAVEAVKPGASAKYITMAGW